MVPRPKGEESEAWNRAAFASLGQKRRVFETPSLIHNEAFHHGKKMLAHSQIPGLNHESKKITPKFTPKGD